MLDQHSSGFKLSGISTNLMCIKLHVAKFSLTISRFFFFSSVCIFLQRKVNIRQLQYLTTCSSVIIHFSKREIHHNFLLSHDIIKPVSSRGNHNSMSCWSMTNADWAVFPLLPFAILLSHSKRERNVNKHCFQSPSDLNKHSSSQVVDTTAIGSHREYVLSRAFSPHNL